MRVYAEVTKQRIRELRAQGYTYTEICTTLGQPIPKGTLSYICRDVVLGPDQKERLAQIAKSQLDRSRQKAVAANKRIFAEKLAGYRAANQDLIPILSDKRTKLIALAMLYLGEGAKWSGTRSLKLGSSSPQILRLYIRLLHDCYGIQVETLKGRIQHRADQDPDELVEFWSEVTGIKPQDFYPCYVDKRTIGQTTRKTGYKGVCTINCSGTHVQLELEQIPDIICEALGL